MPKHDAGPDAIRELGQFQKEELVKVASAIWALQAARNLVLHKDFSRDQVATCLLMLIDDILEGRIVPQVEVLSIRDFIKSFSGDPK